MVLTFFILLLTVSFWKVDLQKPRYNVILIVSDSLRADYLSCYGHPKNLTPNICSLAKDGVLFKNAFSVATCTPKSVASLLFSKYPASHGVLSQRCLLPKYRKTFIEILKENGWTIKTLDQHGWVFLVLKKKNLDTSYWFSHNSSIPNFQIPRKTPFFFWLYLIQTHRPYLISKKLRNFSINQTNVINKMKLRAQNYLPEEIDYIKRRYEEAVKEVDKLVGVFLQQLKKLKAYNNSLIIFTSDHGEAFGEHGFFFHCNKPYNELIHIPLLIKFPFNKYAGKEVEQRVRLIDVAPTILDVMKLRWDIKMDGTSLLPLLEDLFINLTIFAEGGEYFTIIEGNYKYIVSSDFKEEEIYDLKRDPKEIYNLVNDELAETLKKRLLHLLNTMDKTKCEEVDHKQEILRILRELGYIK